MSVNSRTIVIAACLVGTIATAYNQPPLTTYKFEKGQKLKYTTTVTASTDGGGGVMDMQMDTVTEYTVLEVTKDGVRMRSEIVKHESDSSGDHEMPSREGLTREFHVDARGMGSKYKTIDAADAHVSDNESSKLIEPAFGLVLPKGDLKEGMTWKVEHLMQDSQAKMKVKFKVESIDSNGLAIISSKASGSGDATLRSNIGDIEAEQEIKETAEYTFDMNLGLVVAAEKTTESTIISEYGEFYQTRKSKIKLTK